MSHHRLLKHHAIVAMREIAASGGLVFNPRHVRHLREVQQRFPKFITISEPPEGVTPRPHFVAQITPAGHAMIGPHEMQP